MNNRYESLLDTIYELEGLVHLALVRGDNAPKRILSLIREKIDRLQDEKAVLYSGIESQTSDSIIDEYIVEEESPAEEADNEAVEQSHSDKNELNEDAPAESEDEPAEENSDEYGESEEIPLTESIESDCGEVTQPQETHENEEPDEEPEPDEDTLPAPPEVRKEKREAPRFSINDRFLYIREIFGGDDKAFAREMDRLDEFDDYDEAEQYFLEEYSLDLEAPPVQDFLAIIERYYQS